MKNIILGLSAPGILFAIYYLLVRGVGLWNSGETVTGLFCLIASASIICLLVSLPSEEKAK